MFSCFVSFHLIFSRLSKCGCKPQARCESLSKNLKAIKILGCCRNKKKLNKKCEHRDDGMERLIGSGVACVGSLLGRKTKQLCPRTFTNLLLIVYRRSLCESRFGLGRRNCHQDRRCTDCEMMSCDDAASLTLNNGIRERSPI